MEQELSLQAECGSPLEFYSVTHSQYDNTAKKFSTSTPKKAVSCDVSLNTNSDDMEVEMQSNISTSIVSTASPFSVELSSRKDISNNELDDDIIEQLQIHNGRVWDRKYVDNITDAVNV